MVAADLSSLISDIEQAYDDFTVEKNLFGSSAGTIETQLLAALYFTRADAALATKSGSSQNVKAHLERIIGHLAVTEDLMFYGNITAATAGFANSVNARTDIVIGSASSGYSLTSGWSVAPASLGSVFGNIPQSPLSAQATFATLSSGGELPYELAGVSVSIGGQAVQAFYVSPSRVTFFVPADLPTGPAEVIVASQDGYVSKGSIAITPNAARLMTSLDDETGPLLFVNDAKQTMDELQVTTPENLSSDKRTRLTIFAAGISGSAANTDPSNDVSVGGKVIPNVAESVVVEAHTPDGRIYRLPVEFAGAQGGVPGLDQINVVLIPELQGAGAVDLTLIVNGQRSNAPTIVVQ